MAQDPSPPTGIGAAFVTSMPRDHSGAPAMSAEQAEQLRRLCEEAREQYDPSLNEREAERRITELTAQLGH